MTLEQTIVLNPSVETETVKTNEEEVTHVEESKPENNTSHSPYVVCDNLACTICTVENREMLTTTVSSKKYRENCCLFGYVRP